MRFLLSLLLLVGIICLNACTNDEGSSDLDVLTPNDSTQALSPEEN